MKSKRARIPETCFFAKPMIRAARKNLKKRNVVAKRGREVINGADKFLKEYHDRELSTWIPSRRPLQPPWLSQVCPACDADGHWFSWDPKKPDILKCSKCGQTFPDPKFPEDQSDRVGDEEYSFHVSPAGNRYYFSDVVQGYRFSAGVSALCSHRSVDLALAYLMTGDEKYAQPIVETAVALARAYPAYFLLSAREGPAYNDGKGGGVISVDFPEASFGYYSKTSFWGDSTLLSMALIAIDAVKESCWMTSDIKALVREDYVRDALETFVVNKLYYTLNKFHNSHGNYFTCMILAGRLFGSELHVRDLHDSEFILSGPDLVHEAIDGPKGICAFFKNAYGPDGMYFEQTYSYHNHAMKVIVLALLALRGYSDPPGYVPSEWCRRRHRSFRNLNVGTTVPRLLKSMTAFDKLAFPSLICAVDNDSFGNRLGHISAHRYIGAYLLTGSVEAGRTAAAILKANGGKEATEEFLSDSLFFDNYFLFGGSLPETNGEARFRLPSEILPSGFAVMRPDQGTSIHMSWDEIRQYHSHADHLAMQMFAHGKEMLIDLGYMGAGHRMRQPWLNRTIAHNTVTVDRQTPEEHFRGTMGRPLMFGECGSVFALEAEAPEMYEQTTEYRRLCAHVGLHDNGGYVVDFFDVAGGVRHDYALLAGADKCRVERDRFRRTPGTLAGKNVPYEPDNVDSSPKGRTKEIGYRFIYDLQTANLNARKPLASLTWDFEEDVKLAGTIIGEPGMKAVVGSFPVLRGYEYADKHDSLENGKALVVSNRNPGMCESAFATVLEPYVGERSIKTIECRVNDWSGHVIEIAHDKGRDLVMKKASAAWRVMWQGHITNARLAVIRRDERERLAEISLFGDLSADLPELSIHGARVMPVGVAGSDPREGKITLNSCVPEGRILQGEMCRVERGGMSTMFKIRKVKDRTVWIDTDHSNMVYLRGRISKIISPSTFMTSTPLNMDMETGDTVLVGEKRFRLQSFERTSSDPDDFGVYPVNDIYSARIKLENGALTDNDLDREFEASRIGRGSMFVCPVRASMVFGRGVLRVRTNASFTFGVRKEFRHLFKRVEARSHSGVRLRTVTRTEGKELLITVECRKAVRRKK